MLRSDPVLIDSNIIVYSLNSSDVQHESALAFFKKIVEGDVNAVLSYQNILEAFRVLTHPKYKNPMSTKEALIQLGVWKEACKVIYPNLYSLELFFSFGSRIKCVGDAIYDTFLVSTMISNEIFKIATVNTKDFKPFEMIKAFNPLND